MTDSWRTRAACAGADLADFFPRIGQARQSNQDRRRAQETARRYCQGCPALEACAAEADHYRDIGIRGGALRARLNNSAAHGAYRVTRLIRAAPRSPKPATTVDDYRDPAHRRAG